jgi:hypothetical protein
MNKHHVNTLEQQPSASVTRSPATDKPVAIASIDQLQRGANDADAGTPAKLKCVDVLAEVMLHSCSGV